MGGKKLHPNSRGVKKRNLTKEVARGLRLNGCRALRVRKSENKTKGAARIPETSDGSLIIQNKEV